MRTSRSLSIVLVVLLSAVVMAQTRAPKLTIDHLIQIKHPSGHQWTPDGKHVWFTYDDGGVNNVWAVPADGSSPAVALTNYPDGQAGGGGFWSGDGKTFLFQRGGGLLAVPVTGGAPQVMAVGRARGGFTPSSDGVRRRRPFDRLRAGRWRRPRRSWRRAGRWRAWRGGSSR
jgi:hypothetical protein